jgi:hypothetical protein
LNFKKFLVFFIPAALLFGGWKFLTRVDRANPAAVATAFTQALKGRDTGKASSYWVPEQAQTWRTGADDAIDKMKSGATEMYFESIPGDPAFAALPGAAAGTVTMRSSDKSYTLELAQIAGKWYISKAPR